MRPKDIGTAAETKVVRYLAADGFPHAERRALHGGQDLGDVTGTPGVVWEVKGGDAARTASDNQIEAWLGETEVERRNAGEDIGVLVVARHRKNVRDWWAVLWLEQLAVLATGVYPRPADRPWMTYPFRTTLADAVHLLRTAGYGQIIEPTEETP